MCLSQYSWKVRKTNRRNSINNSLRGYGLSLSNSQFAIDSLLIVVEEVKETEDRELSLCLLKLHIIESDFGESDGKNFMVSISKLQKAESSSMNDNKKKGLRCQNKQNIPEMFKILPNLNLQQSEC